MSIDDLPDIEYVHHTVDASHIRNLGEESVSDKMQAVLELVKNAYDADAKKCTVIFHGISNQQGEITIEEISVVDTGIGMTKTDIVTKYLKVGTGNKIQEPFSPKLGRRVSGEKGMGHYSAQRLGNKVTITTTPEPYKGRKFSDTDKHTFVLELDWREYKEGIDFQSVNNRLITKEQNEEFGTTIKISDLKDTWTWEAQKDDDDSDLVTLSKTLGNLVLPEELQYLLMDAFGTAAKNATFPQKQTSNTGMQNLTEILSGAKT